IRNTIVGYKVSDINKLLENVVYLHLCIAGYNVTVGKYNDKEIDFVGEKFGEKIYVQVCYLISDEKVVEREFGNLLSVTDNYPKYVVSMDEVGNTESNNGIRHMEVRKFLRMLAS
ncbi:MAG: ATP-binding protein, partial [Bacteroidetes bacterium]|nr:ATP-binding protein [Bacteroidota bacterium]